MFTKDNPSPKYIELLNLYKQMHKEGEKKLNIPPEHTFDGRSLIPQLIRIKELIKITNSKTLLDYGSGKGIVWSSNLNIDGKIVPTKEFLNISNITLYDPAFEPYSDLPKDEFDCVICTDVLEHIPEDDIPWIVELLFSYSKKALFANVACYPAVKHLPNGENAHCTIKPIEWWKEIFNKKAKNGIKWEVIVQYIENNNLKELKIGN